MQERRKGRMWKRKGGRSNIGREVRGNVVCPCRRPMGMCTIIIYLFPPGANSRLLVQGAGAGECSAFEQRTA